MSDDNGGGYACVGTGHTWEISLPPSQLYCKTGTDLKDKVLGKKILKIDHKHKNFNIFEHKMSQYHTDVNSLKMI